MSAEKEQIVDFQSFLRLNFPDFVIDKGNARVVEDLSLWAARDLKFNNRPAKPGGPKTNWHIDRGIMLIGSVGIGKDEMFRMLRRYLVYLHSPYVFRHKVVWHFAAEFSKEKIGYNAFAQENSKNTYYEELCLTDEQTGIPTREYGNHYGSKVLIGSELIKIRYDLWHSDATMSHFSTNENEQKLQEIYGSRGFSRLKEMCNFIYMYGDNRRFHVEPKFAKNVNTPIPPPKVNVNLEEDILWNKNKLNNDFKEFIATGTLPETVALDFNLLTYNGVHVATDDELRLLMEASEPMYVPDPKMVAKSSSDKERAKRDFIWAQAKKLAVQTFYMRMKEAGAKSIFDEVTYKFNAPNGKLGIVSVQEVVEKAK